MDFERYSTAITQPRSAVVEAVLLPLAMVALGLWLNPLDPLWTQAAFPWPWLAPVVVALRYGPVAGMGSALVLFLAWAGLQYEGLVAAGEIPKVYFLGGLILVMLCSEFSSLAQAQARRAEATQVYLDRRLDQLVRQHYLLRLSHDRLEQDLIARPTTMRDALAAVRAASEAAPAGSPLPGAEALLRRLAQYTQLEAASLHVVREGRLDPSAVVRLGPEFALDAADPLVRHALDKGALAHLRDDEADGGHSRYLVVAPLLAIDGEVHGLLVVERLPFFALHDETLQTLNLLLGYYADGLHAQRVAAPLLAAARCPREFAFELMRLWHIRRATGIGSALVALEFAPRAGYEDLPEQIARQKRALDVVWSVAGGERHVLVTLMPLGSTASAEGYIARIEHWIAALRGETPEQAGVFAHVHLLDTLPPLDVIGRLMSACHVPAQAWSLRADA